jgi:hypothetical protein
MKKPFMMFGVSFIAPRKPQQPVSPCEQLRQRLSGAISVRR